MGLFQFKVGWFKIKARTNLGPQNHHLPLRLPNVLAVKASQSRLFQWQFLVISADGRGFVGILSRWSLTILADGRGFVGILGRWSRVSRHMVQDFSANCQEFVSILGRLSRISWQSWPRICQYSW